MFPASYPIAFIWRTLLLGVVWWGLTGGSPYAMWLGALAVVASAGLSLLTSPPGALFLRPQALLRFLAWFAGQSLLGALDVTRRALHPRLPLRPQFIEYPMGLRDEVARVLFINTLSLMPGTLSAEIKGDRVRLHVLVPEAAFEADLRALEVRVGAVFGEHPTHMGAST